MPKANTHSTTRAAQSDRLETVDIADRLDAIAGGIMLADLAVAGLDYPRTPAVSALRGLLFKLAKKVHKISDDIHPLPAGTAAAEGGAS